MGRGGDEFLARVAATRQRSRVLRKQTATRVAHARALIAESGRVGALDEGVEEDFRRELAAVRAAIAARGYLN